MSVGNGYPFLGYGSVVGVAPEGTFGTFVTATAFIEFNSESFKREREEKILESINTTRSFKKRLIGNETVSGTVEADLNIASDGICYIIKQAMGGTVSSATIGAAGAYVHTFNVGDMQLNASTATVADKPSLSFQVQKGNYVTGTSNIWCFSGCRVNQLTIKGEIGSPVTWSAEIIGQGSSVTTTIPAATFSDILPINFTGVTINTGVTITAVSAEYFTAFEFTLNNNLDGDVRVLGSRNIVQLPPLRREVKLKLTQRFDTTTAYSRYIENTLTAIEINMTAEQTIGAISTTYGCTIKMPAGYYNSNMPEIGGADVITYDVDVTGLYKADPGYDVQILIRNATTGY